MVMWEIFIKLVDGLRECVVTHDQFRPVIADSDMLFRFALRNVRGNRHPEL